MCEQYGIETILSFVFGHNVPSIRLNESFGFTQWGHLPEVAILDGIKRDLIIMGKKVKESTESGPRE